MTEDEKKDKLSLVYKFKTKYSVGFTSEEVEELLKEFPGINMYKFKWAFLFLFPTRNCLWKRECSHYA